MYDLRDAIIPNPANCDKYVCDCNGKGEEEIISLVGWSNKTCDWTDICFQTIADAILDQVNDCFIDSVAAVPDNATCTTTLTIKFVDGCSPDEVVIVPFPESVCDDTVVSVTATPNNVTNSITICYALESGGEPICNTIFLSPDHDDTISIGGVPIIPTTDVNGNHNHNITCDLLVAELDKCFGPTAGDDDYTTPFDTPITGDLTSNDFEDIDPTGGTYQLLSDNTGADGVLVFNADGTFTFTPAAGYCGTTSFTYTATDAEGNVSNIATATIAVECADPIARVSTNFTDAGGNGDYDVTLELKGCGEEPATTGDCVTIEIKDLTNGGVEETLTGKVGDDITAFSSTNAGPSSILNFVTAGVVVDGFTFTFAKKTRWRSQPDWYSVGTTNGSVRNVDNSSHAGYNPIELQLCMTITPVDPTCGTSANTDNFDVIDIHDDLCFSSQANTINADNPGTGTTALLHQMYGDITGTTTTYNAIFENMGTPLSVPSIVPHATFIDTSALLGTQGPTSLILKRGGKTIHGISSYSYDTWVDWNDTITQISNEIDTRMRPTSCGLSGTIRVDAFNVRQRDTIKSVTYTMYDEFFGAVPVPTANMAGFPASVFNVNDTFNYTAPRYSLYNVETIAYTDNRPNGESRQLDQISIMGY